MKALLDRASAALSPDLRRLIVLMAVCFVDMIGLLMIAPLLTFYALRLGGQPSTVGPLFSSFAVAQLLASPIWGRLSDRYGRRWCCATWPLPGSGSPSRACASPLYPTAIGHRVKRPDRGGRRSITSPDRSGT